MQPDWRQGVIERINRARRSASVAQRCDALGAALDLVRGAVGPGEVEGLRRRVRESGPSERLAAELGEALERLLDHPSTRLAVYGTLVPGEVNASVLEPVGGRWSKGVVRGTVAQRGGYRYFSPDLGGHDVEVHVLASSELPEQWPRLDRFEGRTYRRALVLVSLDSSVTVANIYEASGAR